MIAAMSMAIALCGGMSPPVVQQSKRFTHGPAERLTSPLRFYPMSISHLASRIRLGAPIRWIVKNHGPVTQRIVFQAIPESFSSAEVVNIRTEPTRRIRPGKEVRFTWLPSAQESKLLATNIPYRISVADERADSYGGPVYYTNTFKFYRSGKGKVRE